MDKRFCIFDMDGTLVDSMAYWRSLGREYLARQGVTEGVEPILERVKPMTMTESAALFIREYGLSGTPESVAAEMNAVMNEHYRTDIPLKPGALEYLQALRGLGARMCVASATAAPLMEACFRRLGVEEYFDFMLSCEEVGAGKDRPDVFFAAARRLGGSPGETAVFEDALFALRTARNAGFYTVAVYDSSERQWGQLEQLADECVADWETAAKALR